MPFKGRLLIAMKRLLFIALVCCGCNFGPPRKVSEKVPKPSEDSVFIKEKAESGRLNFVVLEKNNYFFKGEISGSTILEFISDSTIVDSLAKSAVGSNESIRVYAAPDESIDDVMKIARILKRREIRFHLVTDDGLKSLRRSNDRKGS